LFTNAYQVFSKEIPQAVTTYNFANGAITSDDYDTYTIGNLTALQNFATSVNNGVDFYGTEIKLTADIDCGGASVSIGGGERNSIDGVQGSSTTYPFSGYFNGCGFTIKNVTYASYFSNKSGSTGGGWITIYTYHYYYGLFVYVDEYAEI